MSKSFKTNLKVGAILLAMFQSTIRIVTQKRKRTLDCAPSARYWACAENYLLAQWARVSRRRWNNWTGLGFVRQLGTKRARIYSFMMQGIQNVNSKKALLSEGFVFMGSDGAMPTELASRTVGMPRVRTRAAFYFIPLNWFVPCFSTHRLLTYDLCSVQPCIGCLFNPLVTSDPLLIICTI
jgi:hypothetical protein